MNSCDELFLQAEKNENEAILFEVETDSSITYGDLRRRIVRLAAHLRRFGVGPKQSVVIHLYNSIDAVVVHLATQYLGARSCFVDALVQPKSLGYYIDITDCRVLVSHISPSTLTPSLTADVTLIHADNIGALSTEPPSSTAPILRGEATPYHWDPDEVCYIYFTSGTTNIPKGVMLSMRNHENFTRICDKYWQPVTVESKHISFVPFSHGFGTVFLVPLAIRTRSKLYIMRAFHPLRVVDTIERHGITHIYGVPSHYQQLLRLPDAKIRLKGLEMAFCAAAKLEHQLMLRWEATTGVILCEGYGLIETCCGIVWRVGTRSKGTGHMGPCPDKSLIEIRILDENLSEVPPGTTGQIAVKGKSVMKGYLKNPEETERIIQNGWLLSGDKGYLTEDGELFMTGRIKDIINIAGIKVSPYEIEAVLHQHPDVAEVAVVAAPDALYGEVAKAFVRKESNANTTERELIRFASERLISFQVPKYIDFVDEFPLNNMGKLDRKKLRTLSTF